MCISGRIGKQKYYFLCYPKMKIRKAMVEGKHVTFCRFATRVIIIINMDVASMLVISEFKNIYKQRYRGGLAYSKEML